MIRDIPCVILSGGKSSRMREDAGIDKAFLDFWGEPLYYRQYQKLSKIFESVYLNTKSAKNYDKIESKQIIEDLTSVEGFDTSELFAPTLGMLSAFETLQSDRIFFIGVDTPFISEESIQNLILRNAPFIAAQSGEKIHPTVAVYDKSISSELTRMIKQNKHKLTLLLEKIGTIFVQTGNEKEFLNLNRYEDYKKVIEDGVNPFR
jgi:molybdopterin-guanine dinucleotide biosynthesis protein A